MEDDIKADSPIAFVGPYNPTVFRGGGYVRNVNPSDYDGFESPIPAEPKEEE